jgi:ABC-2 type transport system permease protein
MGSFFVTTPAFVLSGFMFPIRNMPPVVQYLSYLNPLRYFMEIVRGIFLKGVGVSVLWPQMVCLFVYGTSILLFSAARFRKTLD